MINQITDLPSIGKKAEADLNKLGIFSFADMSSKDPYELYVALCLRDQFYYDPCVLDQFIEVYKFATQGEVKKWWEYTDERKANWHKVLPQIQLLL